MGRAPSERPKGLEYRPDFVTEAEERQAVAVIEALEFHEVAMRGQVARRKVRHFDLRYDYEGHGLTPTDPFPGELEWLRERCSDFAGVEPTELAETLVTRYPPGAPIGWHRDAPMFGKVVGVSLGASARMRFQRGKGAERRVFELELEPRSAYLLAGSVRWAWQHSIPPTNALRYSVTFRTLRSK
jgi:alkylated DNA repair dioxygenase AlkB